MKKKITAWVARDADGEITLFMTDAPFKASATWVPQSYDNSYLELDKNDFPEVKWEDEKPTKVELTIKICE